MRGRIIKVLLAAVIFMASRGVCTASAVIRSAGGKTDIPVWIDARFASSASLPFSFRLDGRPSSEFIGRWKKSVSKLNESPSKIETRYSWTSVKDGLSVICDVTGYPESKAVEWVLHFSNISDSPTGQISDVKVIDARFDFPSAGDTELHYAEGNKISRADYSPRTAVIEPGSPIHFEIGRAHV